MSAHRSNLSFPATSFTSSFSQATVPIALQKEYAWLRRRVGELEGQVREARTPLAAIVEFSDDAIIGTDLNGIVQSWNRGAQRVFGYTAKEAIGKPVSVVAAPEREDELPTVLDRLKHGERVDHYETKRRRKDGGIITVSVRVSPIKDASGNVIGASKVAREITERGERERVLQAANEALRRANADLEQFSYTAAHDLQEPLRMVTIYSQMLQRKYAGQLDEQAHEFIRYCVDGASRMETLVRDALAYTRSTTLDDEPRAPVNLTGVVAQALGNLHMAVLESGAEIIYDGLPEVRAHGPLMQQLFQNLISNAIKYRSQGVPEVKVWAERGENEWRVAVRDNGMGVPPKYQKQIFGLFKRLHRADEYPGTGLGLAICQRIVARHGGEIWVESTGRGGSTFYFTLPD